MALLGIANTLNRARYAGLDFNTHLDDILARMQVKYAADFNDFAVTSLAIVLLDVSTFGLDTLSFYLDRRATEAYLATARTRGAVSRLTRQLGYKMGAAIASSVDLSVALKTDHAFDVPIVGGPGTNATQFRGENGLIYEAAKDVTFAAGLGASDPQIVPCYEGETVVEQFTSDGTALQVFELARVPADKMVAKGAITVTVNGDLWEERDFIEFEQTDHYEFAANDDPPTVRFGDGTAGNIPATDAAIVVTYVATSGKAGQAESGTITELAEPLVVSATNIQLTISNSQPVKGGDDLESLERAKTMAPKVYKSRGVAITGPDYNAIAGSFADPLFGRVAVAKAIASKSAQTDLTLQSYVETIRDAVDDPVPVVASSKAAAEAVLDTIDTQAQSIEANLGSTASQNQQIDSALDTLRASAVVVRGKAGDISNSGVDIQTTAAEGRAALETSVLPTLPTITDLGDVFFNNTTKKISRNTGSWLTDGVRVNDVIQFSGTVGNNSKFTVAAVVASEITTVEVPVLEGPVAAVGTLDISDNDRLSTATRTNLDNKYSSVSSSASTVSSLSSDIVASSNTQVSTVDTAKNAMDLVGTSVATAGTYLYEANTAAVDIHSTQTDLVRAELTAIDTVVVDTSDTVNTALDNILTHIGRFLSDDCKANLINVPILALDNAGFYSAPTIGLVEALQIKLDGLKEVTQVVSVTSGEPFLIRAQITVRLGVPEGTGESTASAAVSAEIDTVLRGRKFGACLKVAEINRAVENFLGDSGFYNVTIDGYLDSDDNLVTDSSVDGSTGRDSDGNLIIQGGEIITKGAVIINTEPATQICPAA
jgi:hypothetical protein